MGYGVFFTRFPPFRDGFLIIVVGSAKYLVSM